MTLGGSPLAGRPFSGGIASAVVASTAAVGRRFKQYAKAYLKRGHKVMVFESEEDKAQFLEAEKPAIKTSKKTIAVKPVEVIQIPELERQVERFQMAVPVQKLFAERNFARLFTIHLRVLEQQDEEDIELLLLA